MIIELHFREINKTVKNSTAKPQNSRPLVNLPEKRRDIVGVHQRAADSLQRL